MKQMFLILGKVLGAHIFDSSQFLVILFLQFFSMVLGNVVLCHHGAMQFFDLFLEVGLEFGCDVLD